MGELLAFLSVIGYTSQLIFIKKGCKDKSESGSIPIQLVVVLSAVIITLIIYMLQIILIQGKTFSHMFMDFTAESFLFIALDGLLGPMGGALLLTKATELIGPSKASVLRGSSPLFAMLLAALLLQERPGINGVVGIILLVVGIFLVTWKKQNTISPTATMETRQGSRKNFIGSSLALLGGLSFAFSQIARGMAIQKGASPEAIVFWGLLVSFFTLYFLHFVTKKHMKFTLGLKMDTMKYYVYAGAGNMMGSFMLAWSFVYTDVWKAIAIRNLQPIIAILMSWMILKQQEIITKRLVFGASLVLMAIWISML